MKITYWWYQSLPYKREYFHTKFTYHLATAPVSQASRGYCFTL